MQSEAHTSCLSQGYGLVPASWPIAQVSVIKKLLVQLESTALQPARAVLLRTLQLKMKMASFFSLIWHVIAD